MDLFGQHLAPRYLSPTLGILRVDAYLRSQIQEKLFAVLLLLPESFGHIGS